MQRLCFAELLAKGTAKQSSISCVEDVIWECLPDMDCLQSTSSHFTLQLWFSL